MSVRVVVCLFPILLSGCSLLTPKRETGMDFATISEKPLTPEQTEEMLNRTGENWLFGQGIGETTLNVATSIAFPPYAVYVLGNGVLNLSGYEPLYISNALPTESRAMWNSAYDAVTSVPGRASASIAGRDFIPRDAAEARLQEVLKAPPNEAANGKAQHERITGDESTVWR